MARQEPGEPYFRVDSDEAAQILETERDNAVVVDVRRDDEWVSGHAKGAIHILIDELMGRIDELPKDKKLLFICAAGHAAAWHARLRRPWSFLPRTCITWRTAPPRGSRKITPPLMERTHRMTLPP